jgi:hypothetical protein
MNDKIKIGLIIDSGDLPLWTYRVIKKISCDESAEIKLIIYNEGGINGSRKADYSFFYNLHLKLDQLILRNRTDFNKSTDVSKLLQGMEKISLNQDHFPLSQEFRNKSREISRSNLDVILNLSSELFHESGLKISKFGIWQFLVGNRIASCDDRIGYWEFMTMKPAAEAVLLSSNNHSGKEVVIHRSWFPLNYNSITINSDHAHELFVITVMRLIRDLQCRGSEYFNSLILRYEEAKERSNSRINPPPSNLKALVNIFVVLFRFIRYKIEFTIRWRWFLLYRFNKNQFPDATSSFMTLFPPKDRFWADPFVICRENTINIFIEEVIYGSKGHITLLQLEKDGKFLQSQRILERPYHLSYPFVFEYNNVYYMIPETCENKTIEIYRCDEFPIKWSFVMTLQKDVKARDTTVFFHKDKWWLFTAINESDSFEDYVELHLYYSDNLLSSDWVSHPGNPVVTDIATARPAGKIFAENGKLYRPSQDCSIRYGRALNLNQITILSETSYGETLLYKTEATWLSGLKGTHTYNFDGSFSIIDAYKY